MDRALCIFLPTWDVDLLQRKISRFRQKQRKRPALLLVTNNAQQRIVARCCSVAAASGVLPGMTLAEARALGPAHVAPFNADRSRQALDVLAKWCLRFSPVSCVDPTPWGGHSDPSPDGLFLDVTGQEHLFGTEHLMLMEISTRLCRVGFSSRLAIAPTLGAAWGIAHCGPQPHSVVHEDQLHAALALLPIEALRLPAATCSSLREIGIEQVRHLTALTRESLLIRFGEELLMRLDQALGRVNELINPIHPTEPISVVRIFDGTCIQLEAIMLTVEALIGMLCRKLLDLESGVRGLRLELLRVNAPPVSHELVVGRPTRDEKHLWQLLRAKVERLHLGYGVEAVRMTAYWTEAIRHVQLGAWETGEGDTHDAAFDALLDTLISRWGANRVLSARAVASHTPEVARQFRPVLEASDEEPQLAFVDRPTVLFDRPEPAEAITLQPDCPPSFIRWRGEGHALSVGQGPERITTAWWGTQRTSTRDYFKVQIVGGSWVWTFREVESSRWYVHGLWA